MFNQIGFVLLVGCVMTCSLSFSARGASESVIYSFQGGSDGQWPFAKMIQVDNLLYGTTSGGGNPNFGYGIVFTITPEGVEKLLTTFSSYGFEPTGGLNYFHGDLYGTTSQGGTANCFFHGPCGTVYKVTRKGHLTTLHSFSGGEFDGSFPSAGLINFGDALYGMTPEGGGDGCSNNLGCGTVYKVTSTGDYNTVYFFGANGSGTLPFANLLAANNLLYGTTSQGGTSGGGTVFSLTTGGVQLVLDSFSGGADGAYPMSTLVNEDGTLYGTTTFGGGSSACTNGCGTIFKITPDGAKTILYSFKGGTDGANPAAGLTKLGTALFGTTEKGGSTGNGTVFRITLTGHEKVIYSFRGGADGSEPMAGLLAYQGNLYGTTAYGGASSACPSGAEAGCGTVFKIVP